MSLRFTVAAVFISAFVLANLPFFGRRLFFFFGPHSAKNTALILKFLLCYGLFLAFGFYMESQVAAVVWQGGFFYAATACLFVLFAFPGFTWRFLLKKAQE